MEDTFNNDFQAAAEEMRGKQEVSAQRRHALIIGLLSPAHTEGSVGPLTYLYRVQQVRGLFQVYSFRMAQETAATIMHEWFWKGASAAQLATYLCALLHPPNQTNVPSVLSKLVDMLIATCTNDAEHYQLSPQLERLNHLLYTFDEQTIEPQSERLRSVNEAYARFAGQRFLWEQ
jgi:hypothetical protein